jgi:hypothetical protein
MARFDITIDATLFSVRLASEVSTDCANIYQYEIISEAANNIDIILTPNAVNSYYISNGVTTFFNATTTIAFDTSLTLVFALENSGNSGFFDSVDISIEDKTTANPYSLFESTVTRENDNAKCNTSSSSSSETSCIMLPPQLFNPTAPEVVANIGTFNLLNSRDVVFMTINGQVLDDSEYSLSGSVLTVTPDNGFNAITDEVLVFQTTVVLTGSLPTANYRVLSASGPILDTDNVVNAVTGGITASLPTAVGIAGKIFTYKNSSLADVFLDAAGVETIDGVLVATIIPDQSIEVMSTGTNWIII